MDDVDHLEADQILINLLAPHSERALARAESRSHNLMTSATKYGRAVETLLVTSPPRTELRLCPATGRVFLIAACLLILSAPLFARDWRISNFQDTVSIGADGSAAVRERITLVFVGEFH